MIRGKAQVIRGNKPRPPAEGLFCSYSHRTCMQNRLDGFDYCLKHILEDKNSPYKQCSFVSGKTGKRCPSAASKSDRKEGYCLDHSKRAAILRQKSQRKKKPKATSESLLEELAHHNNPSSSSETVLEVKKSRLPSDSLANKVLDYASSSDSEAEPPLVDQAWRGDGDSDAESIDSEQEDLLKHAGTYTAEEVALILRDKLIRLQSLYIDQFKRLQHVMKEKRRKYLHSYKQERETLGSIKAYKTDLEQKEKYEKLKSLKRYHKRYGKEALLHRQSKQRRIAVSEGQNYRPPSYPKCGFIEDGVKCSLRTIPLSKFCIEHILQDPHQILYQPCSFAEQKCGRPVAACANTPFCLLHIPLQDLEPRLPGFQKSCQDAVEKDKLALKEVTKPGPLNEKNQAATPTHQEIRIKESMVSKPSADPEVAAVSGDSNVPVASSSESSSISSSTLSGKSGVTSAPHLQTSDSSSITPATKMQMDSEVALSAPSQSSNDPEKNATDYENSVANGANLKHQPMDTS